MVTRRSGSSSNSSTQPKGNGSAFHWGSPGAMVGVALGGAALAVAANLGRKFLVQGQSASAGNWADSLAAEHEMVLHIFDRMLATDDSQTIVRGALLMKLSHALDKHAYAEEHVVYPSLREMGDTSDAGLLEKEHGEVKTYLHRLHNMAKDSPEWRPTVREFRSSVAQHARFEEEEVFPLLRADIDEELDRKITHDVNRAGFLMA